MANQNDKVILHPSPDRPNGVCATVVADPRLTIEEAAQLIVPEGQPYLIVDRADLPPDDGVWFEAWEADFSEPDGYGINNEEWFAAHPPEDPNG